MTLRRRTGANTITLRNRARLILLLGIAWIFMIALTVGLAYAHEEHRALADVHVVIMSPEEIDTFAKENGLALWNTALGMARWTNEKCEIYVPPLSAHTLSIWIHELYHCVAGDFHPRTLDDVGRQP